MFLCRNIEYRQNISFTHTSSNSKKRGWWLLRDNFTDYWDCLQTKPFVDSLSNEEIMKSKIEYPRLVMIKNKHHAILLFIYKSLLLTPKQFLSYALPLFLYDSIETIYKIFSMCTRYNIQIIMLIPIITCSIFILT